jgi:hypothetical protein
MQPEINARSCLQTRFLSNRHPRYNLKQADNQPGEVESAAVIQRVSRATGEYHCKAILQPHKAGQYKQLVWPHS